MRAQSVCLVLAATAATICSCQVFPGKAERDYRAYQRYVEKSMRERDKRRALIAEEKRREADRIAIEAAAAEPPATEQVLLSGGG